MANEPLTFEAMMAFAAEQVEREEDGFEGEIPKHAARLLTGNTADLQRTIVNIEMARANEQQDDPSDDNVRQAIEGDAVDVLLVIGALAKEYDLDLPSAFRDRMEYIENYNEMQEAMDEAETREEMVDAVDEHMDEEIAEQMGGVEAGVNVDADGYEHDETDKSFQ